ncbi:hypothetical protein [Bacillus paranthracis]|uniref:hypothetical protein n=1 Tax=Bacillus paranthracis TaxID=2026186 RepID=UPI0029C1A298|nr:hypothetical protein [Bacillus paranthracis]MDX6043663.1 hypothetical protein [Bacillus paranthracis]
MVLRLRDQDYNLLLNEYADANFDLEESIQTSIEYLTELKSSHIENTCDFQSNQWTIFHNGRTSRLTFNFDLTSQQIRFHLSMDENEKLLFVQIVKCWVVSLLDSLDIYSAHKYLRYLNRFISNSNCFQTDEETVESVKNSLHRINEETKHTAFVTCIAILNFIDYYEDIDSTSLYTKIITDMKNEIGYTEYVRKLPPPRDVFLFSTIIDDYFSKLPRESEAYIHYFPVLLWWKLTNLIPLRPFEFCSIKRDALTCKDGGYYIKLPRSNKKGGHRKNRNRIQIVDIIKIPLDIALEIQHYIKLTEDMGHTETLISYKSIRSTLSVQSGKPLTESRFYPGILFRVIERFYEYVVKGSYGYSTQNNPYRSDNTNIIPSHDSPLIRISAGDTRHFAFLNLMRLGYNPVEIARMGGHMTLKTQYHYHNHEDFILNVEVLKLMNKFRFEKETFSNNDSSNLLLIGNSAITETFNLSQLIKERFVKKPIQDTKTKKKLEIGHCTDPNQRCLVHDCFLCDYWWVSHEEYIEKNQVITEKIQTAYDHIKNIIATIEHIHNHITIHYQKDIDMGELDPQYNRDLAKLSKNLDTSLHNFAKLKVLKERMDTNDN